MATLHELLTDLEAEYSDVRELVTPFAPDAPEWEVATPAEGWSIRDQISHLAFFDETGWKAMAEPTVFEREAAEAMAADGDPMEPHLTQGRLLDGQQLLQWWDRAHRQMMMTAAEMDPSARIPWYGPPMGLLSFLSARLMETWAHGQDVADGLGQPRVPTDRVRHIAHLGIRTRSFSYAARGRPVPPGQIDVQLVGPSGATWSWEVGQSIEGASSGRISGSALEFCLVVTQRRNVGDTSLLAEGPTAADWLSIAQAFAGPPGPGRPPRSGGDGND